MPAKDTFHDAVKHALEKDGWIITHDPYFLHVGVDLTIDLGAEEMFAAEKEGQKIAVEVKSFVSQSAISEFHTALGQYLNYKQALEQEDPERILYLAVPMEAFDAFFTLYFVQTSLQRHQIKLFVYHPGKEVIVKWQK
jgi:hypothetical protein